MDSKALLPTGTCYDTFLIITLFKYSYLFEASGKCLLLTKKSSLWFHTMNIILSKSIQFKRRKSIFKTLTASLLIYGYIKSSGWGKGGMKMEEMVTSVSIFITICHKSQPRMEGKTLCEVLTVAPSSLPGRKPDAVM